MTTSLPRLIAFYLPQFHPINENDQWWGKGFTEWTNTAKAKPLFPGHYQPHVPADLGFYDLRLREARQAQADLARSYGIEGFCYYHYWFGNGRRLLERPFEEVLASGEPDFPFCLCWANETWSGIWHGTPNRVLMKQEYAGPDDDQRHFEALLLAFKDHRYLRIDGKPVFLIWQPFRLPDPKATLERWREMAKQSGLAGLHLVGIYREGSANPEEVGFDASIYNNNPPLRAKGTWQDPVKLVYNFCLEKFGLPTIYRYKKAIDYFIPNALPITRYPQVINAWDNTPRSGANGLVFHGSTPVLFRNALRKAFDLTRDPARGKDGRLVFLKSWNEWAEGNHLEPDLRHGHSYLEAIRAELEHEEKYYLGILNRMPVQLHPDILYHRSLEYFRSFFDTFATYTKFLRIFIFPRSFKSQQTVRHLLLLAWAYPPEVTGGVYRPMAIVHAAKRRGWRITVICGQYPTTTSSAGRYLEETVADIGQIVRLEPSMLKPSYKLLAPKISGGFLNMLETIEIACKVLVNDLPSIILASGPPFHNFVVAREISKRFGKPYVLDYRDEWTECPFDFVDVGNIDRYFENKCIRDASKVIFTTVSHYEHQRSCFEISDETKLVVIPNGWEAEDIPDDSTVNPLEAIYTRLAFVGYLGEHTLPKQFLLSLNKLLLESPDLVNKLRITFVGDKSEVALSQLRSFAFPQVIEILNIVPKPVALKIMQDADGLLLINEPRLGRYIPGKLYNYVAMRTPIIAYGGGGEVEDLVTNLQVGIVVKTDSHTELYSALLKLHDFKQNMYSSNIDVWLAKHTRNALSETIVNLLEDVENEIAAR